MFLDNLRTNGNVTKRAIIITINAVLRELLKNKKDMIKAAIPTATFNP